MTEQIDQLITNLLTIRQEVPRLTYEQTKALEASLATWSQSMTSFMQVNKIPQE